MDIESQVCSLELAQRLKKLGVKQESYFIWAHNNLIPRLSVLGLDKHELFEPYICSAFTVVELGEMLPAILESDTPSKAHLKFDSCKDILNRWMTAYFYDFNRPPKMVFIENKEADARAKMIIFLLENGLMKNNDS